VFTAVECTVATAHIKDGLEVDELHTLKHYAAPGPTAALGWDLDYVGQDVNNHVLNSLLVGVSWRAGWRDEVGLRFWSWFLGALTVPAAFYLAWVCGFRPTGRLALSALVAASPTLGVWSALMRGYGPSIFFVTLLVSIHIDAILAPRRWKLVLLGFVTCATVLCLFSNFLIVVGLGFHLVMLGLWSRSVVRRTASPYYPWHLTAIGGGLVAALAIEGLLIPGYIKSSVIQRNQGVGLSLADFGAAIVTDWSADPQRPLWVPANAVVGSGVIFAVLAGLIVGCRSNRPRVSTGLTAAGLLVLAGVGVAFVGKLPARSLLPARPAACSARPVMPTGPRARRPWRRTSP
jgi:hypothetical protein